MKKLEIKERISFYDQIARNKRKSFFLIVVIFIVFVALGYVISFAFSPDYFFVVMILSIIISITYILISYYNSDKIALASVRAREAPREYRQYYNSVEGLCLASGMPMPRLYIMQSEQVNAFATGRNPQNSAICVTTGALNKLNKQELEGVLAHELSHVANYDIRFMTLVAVMVGMIAIISELFLRSLWYRGGGGGGGGGRDREGKGNAILMLIGIALAILAPIVVQLVQFAISRRREYAADASAVKFTRSPTGLRDALIKIKDEKPIRVSKALAPLFMSDPYKRDISNLLSTHPPLEKRIELLDRM